MIGIVITGHGHFATGLTSSLELIAGKPEYYEAVDFTKDDTDVTLTDKLKKAFANLKDCSGILVFTDLVGGSPFKIAAELSVTMADQYHIAVVSGTNLGSLIETNLTRTFNDDLNVLADAAMDVAKSQCIHFTEVKDRQEEDTEDGI